MKRLLFVLLAFLSVTTEAAEESLGVLDAEFWFTPRHGDVVLGNDKVGAAVKRLIAEPDAYLALRYPATETGELWSEELQAWLVSLGLVSDRIELQSGYDLIEGVELVVIAPDVEIDLQPEQIDAGVTENSEAVDLNQEDVSTSESPMIEAQPDTDQAAEPQVVEEPKAEEPKATEQQDRTEQE